jgi:AcrR family transcriptional regulator
MVTAPQIQDVPRSETTRRAILDAAQALLLEVGVERLSIRRVSERCGFKAPTIYHHFRDKNGLVDALIEECFREILERMQRVPRGDDPAAYLREIARSFIAFQLEHPEHFALLAAPRLERDDPPAAAEQSRALVFRALEEVAAAGSMGGVDVETAFQAIWVVLHGIASLRISRPGYAWSPELVETVLDMIERGLLGKEAGA